MTVEVYCSFDSNNILNGVFSSELAAIKDISDHNPDAKYMVERDGPVTYLDAPNPDYSYTVRRMKVKS